MSCHFFWSLSSDVLPLSHHEVHVWAWSLEAPSALADLRMMLSADEAARADRFVFERHRCGYIVAHAQLRKLLAAYVGKNPRHLTFAAGQNGKPELEGNTQLQFNLTHSEELALLAVSTSFAVGVDVERVRSVEEGIAERYFSRSEQLALRAFSPDKQLEGFYQCWTRKESYLKGIGLGLAVPLDSFEVPLAHDNRLAGQVRTQSGHSTDWHIQHLEPAEGYVGALAVCAPEWKTRCFALR